MLMHHDTLAALGVALQCELQELLHNDTAALADLVGEAERWLTSLDRQWQALAAWLTSSSVAVALPFSTLSLEEDSVLGQHMVLPPEALHVSSARATYQPAADFSAASRLDALSSARSIQADLSSPTARFMDSARHPEANAQVETNGSTTVRSSTTPLSPSITPTHPEAGVPWPAPVTSDLELPIQKSVLPDTASSPRGEADELPLPANGAPAGRVDAPTRDLLSATTAPMETAADTAERFAGAPPEASMPPLTVMSPFSPVKNLQDLAQLLGADDYAALSSLAITGTAPSDAVVSDTAGDTAPARLAQSQENTPGQALTVMPVQSVGQETLSGGDPAGERPVAPLQEEVSEIDLEAFLDILGRRMAEEYRRFYGS
jgi:hypothetical protein